MCLTIFSLTLVLRPTKCYTKVPFTSATTGFLGEVVAPTLSPFTSLSKAIEGRQISESIHPIYGLDTLL